MGMESIPNVLNAESLLIPVPSINNASSFLIPSENAFSENAAQLAALNSLLPLEHSTPEREMKEKGTHRAACHRCGNMRKSIFPCTNWFLFDFLLCKYN